MTSKHNHLTPPKPNNPQDQDEVLAPTLQLRWLHPTGFSSYPGTLQQAFHNPITGELVWRDVTIALVPRT